jgi:hypothetical protein
MQFWNTQRIVIHLIFLFIQLMLLHAKPPSDLIVIEKGNRDGMCNTKEIVKYSLTEAGAVRKVLLKLSTDEIRFDLGDNFLLKNRFLVTTGGDIIDLDQKKIIYKGAGRLLRIVCDNVYIATDNIGMDEVSVLKFNVNTKSKVTLSHGTRWTMPGVLSPNGDKSVISDNWGNVWLYVENSKKRLIGEGFNAKVSYYSSDPGIAPVFWVDDENILTQKRNGHLVLLSLEKQITSIVNIKLDQTPSYPPQLYKDLNDDIIYQCGDDCFKIDIVNKKYEKEYWRTLGAGFLGELNKIIPRIMFHNEIIGKGNFDIYSAKAILGYLSIIQKEVEESSNGVLMIWREKDKDWIKIGGDSVEEIVGWIE